jgi:site-specific DNA recombinase
MTRVPSYARYSSDNQRDASIEDQLRICREKAEREKWTVVSTYKDAGISGASMILRPSIQTLLQDAQRQQFDVVLAEALDRISRDQADVATLFKHLRFAGVSIIGRGRNQRAARWARNQRIFRTSIRTCPASIGRRSNG